jgi:hypothetical protein
MRDVGVCAYMYVSVLKKKSITTVTENNQKRFSSNLKINIRHDKDAQKNRVLFLS